MNKFVPNSRSIHWFDCCTNGKSIKGRKGIPNHMFVILTKTSYNENSEEFGALPITSLKQEKNQEFLLNYGINITNDDIEDIILTKESFVLCDRPCRLSSENHSKEIREIGRIKNKELFDAILSGIWSFLKRGKVYAPLKSAE